MTVYNIPPVPIPTSSSSEGPAVGVEPTRELTKDEILGNVKSYEYSITNYCAGLSKVVRFKSKDRYFFTPYKKNAKEFKYDEKLSQSLSRTRRLILEYALCNDWKWFGTLTIDPGKEEREDLAKYYKNFYKWLEYQRLKTGKKIPFLLVPEPHIKRGWHLHGLFNSDIDELLVSFAELDQAGYRSATGKQLPRGLIKGGYWDLPAYRDRFGFCSFGEIRKKLNCAFYVSKYITKSLAMNKELQGKQLYRVSEKLLKAELIGRVYCNTPALDAVITRHYEFCSTGWFQYEPEIGYEPLLDIIEERGDSVPPKNTHFFDLFTVTDGEYLPVSFDLDSYPPDLQQEVDAYYEATQLAIQGFERAAGAENKRKTKR